MMMQLTKKQKNETNRFAMLSVLILKQIFDHLTNLSFCRAVSKKGFLPEKYANSVVFLPNSTMMNVTSYLDCYKHIQNVTFDRCAHLNGNSLAVFFNHVTSVDSIIVRRCPNVSYIPCDEIIEDNGTSFVIRIHGRTLKLEFQGCWDVVGRPEPTMTPAQVLDIVMACSDTASYRNMLHVLPFLFSISTEQFTKYIQIFGPMFNDPTFVIRDQHRWR